MAWRRKYANCSVHCLALSFTTACLVYLALLFWFLKGIHCTKGCTVMVANWGTKYIYLIPSSFARISKSRCNLLFGFTSLQVLKTLLYTRGCFTRGLRGLFLSLWNRTTASDSIGKVGQPNPTYKNLEITTTKKVFLLKSVSHFAANRNHKTKHAGPRNPPIQQSLI